MPLRKDRRVYRANFRNLKLNAWGFDQVIKESFSISVFQASCSPERWEARPQLSRQKHEWTGASAAAVQAIVAADFEEQLCAWSEEPPRKAAQPSLRSGADVAQPSKEA
jgi:hypothetical protein